MRGYQVGDLICISEDDPTYKDRPRAEAEAIEMSRGGQSIMGVWTSQEEGSELVSIAHEGELFRKSG